MAFIELYRKYRPSKLKDVLGQEGTVSALQKLLSSHNLPHALLFSGPSGVGKTTLARILKAELGCGDYDFIEVNAADSRGVDTIREIRSHMGLSPISGGKCRIWLLDEIHALTRDSMSALIKMLEDTPSHVYFFLCTTDPSKLLKTIITRCTHFQLKSISPNIIESLVKAVCKQEKLMISEEVIDSITENAEGSARKALVLLHQVMGSKDEEEQLEILAKTSQASKGIDIARALFDGRTKWGDIAKLIKEVEDEPETIRHIVLGYANTILLSGGKLANRAYLVITVFADNWYDSKKAGLTAACWEVLGNKL